MASGKSFRTASVQISVKNKKEEGKHLHEPHSSALSARGHRKGVLDGIVIAKFGVFSNPDFSRENQTKGEREIEHAYSISRPCRKQYAVPGQNFYEGWLQLRSPTSQIPHRLWDSSGPCDKEHPRASFGGRLVNVFRTINWG